MHHLNPVSISLLTLMTSNFGYIQPTFALDQQKVLAALQTVVMVRGYNDTGGLSYGSGVMVGDNKVMTNCHIFRSTKQPWVARGEDTYSIVSVQADRWHDLCLLKTSGVPFRAANIGNSRLLQRGQEVLSIGHSNGVPTPLTSVGTIKTTYQFESEKVIRGSAQFRMGASGSGIFDIDGNLLGINTFKTPGKPAYFYSLPIEWLASLEKRPVETTFPIIGKAFWEEDDDKKPFFMQTAIPELNQDWLKLEQVAQKWIVADPKNSDAWYALGNAQENLHKSDEAKITYQKSVALDVNNTDALFRLGIIAKSVGDRAGMHEANIAIANINKELAQEYSRMLGCGVEC